MSRSGFLHRCFGFLGRKFGSSHPGIRLRSKVKDYKKYGFFQSLKPHKYGFSVANWNIFELTPQSCSDYLSDAQYVKMHPLNGIFSKWIDDKLTLKYLLAGTELNRYMPEYYFQIDGKGALLTLPDFPQRNGKSGFGAVADYLKGKKELAVKKIAGSIGAGFYKAEYDGTHFLLNGEAFDEEGFLRKLETLRNYLIIEYLHPHPELAEYCPATVNSIRFLAGRMENELKMLKGFIRFGTKKSGFVENYNAGGVLCYLDGDGKFTEGNVLEGKKNQKIRTHPDSGKELSGQIPEWDQIREIVGKFSQYFPQLSYLGFDFVITSEGKVKMLEINSLTSLDSLQLDGSILLGPSGDFFRERIGK